MNHTIFQPLGARSVQGGAISACQQIGLRCLDWAVVAMPPLSDDAFLRGHGEPANFSGSMRSAYHNLTLGNQRHCHIGYPDNCQQTNPHLYYMGETTLVFPISAGLALMPSEAVRTSFSRPQPLVGGLPQTFRFRPQMAAMPASTTVSLYSAHAMAQWPHSGVCSSVVGFGRMAFDAPCSRSHYTEKSILRCWGASLCFLYTENRRRSPRRPSRVAVATSFTIAPNTFCP